MKSSTRITLSPCHLVTLSFLKGRDKGTVAITFLLSFPIFIAVVGVLVQYALLVNARMGVDRAAMAAARAAVTSLPTDPDVDELDGDQNVLRAACMALEPLSPRATSGASPDAQDIASALQIAGMKVPDSYVSRYSYAEDATTVEWTRVDDAGNPLNEPTWEPLDFAQHAGQRIKLTVHYKFYLTVPGIRSLPTFGQVETVAGINGRFLTLTASYIVQLTHGREAGVNNVR